MGLLQNGQWVDQWYDSDDGEFHRQHSQIRNWITADGSAGPTGKDGFNAEPGRYRLYVSYACPWACRTLIFRELKDLQALIDVVVVDPLMLEHGWEFDDQDYGLNYLYELYLKHDSHYQGRVTVPVLWDKHSQQIVNNESADIIRMFNSAFNGLTGNHHDYYPEALRSEINQVNERLYENICNGVYRAGFATSQAAYEKAYYKLFATLDWLEQRLAQQPYLTGAQLTEADWRVFGTLIRFDAVYYSHFKCNRQRLSDYPNISGFLRELYQQPGIADTVHFDHIKTHYFASHRGINPTGIVPLGPEQNFTAAHGRDRFKTYPIND
jgi:putative glutathione S-transferase